MPNKDGTGPCNQGANGGKKLSGRGSNNYPKQSQCNRKNRNDFCGQDFGKSFGECILTTCDNKTEKELLQEKKAILERRLQNINDQLKDL